MHSLNLVLLVIAIIYDQQSNSVLCTYINVEFDIKGMMVSGKANKVGDGHSLTQIACAGIAINL